MDQLQRLGADGPVAVAAVGDESDDPALAVAFELGVQLAGMGARVLVVDLVIGAPRLHQIIERPVAPGLAEILTGREQLGSTIAEVTGVPGLSVLTRGGSSAAIEAGLRGASLSRLLGRARLDYHALLLIGGRSDTETIPALAGLCDAVLVGTEKPIGSTVDPALTERLESLSATTLDVVSVSPLPPTDGDPDSSSTPDSNQPDADQPDADQPTDPAGQNNAAEPGDSSDRHDTEDQGDAAEPSADDGREPGSAASPPALPPLSPEQRAAARDEVNALITSEFDRLGNWSASAGLDSSS
jgi:hypothetical protein